MKASNCNATLLILLVVHLSPLKGFEGEFYNDKNSLDSNEEDLTKPPKGMEWKRFMWNAMDDAMDSVATGMASGAKVFQDMFDMVGIMDENKKPTIFEPFHTAAGSTKTVKYTIHQPKQIRPKRIIKTIQSVPSVAKNYRKLSPLLPKPTFFKLDDKKSENFLDQKSLRALELIEEEKVEANLFPSNDDNNSNKYKNFVTTTRRPTPISELHTKVAQNRKETSIIKPSYPKDTAGYEVTENSAEETVQVQQNAEWKPIFATAALESYRPDNHQWESYSVDSATQKNYPKTTTTTTSSNNVKSRPKISTRNGDKKQKFHSKITDQFIESNAGGFKNNSTNSYVRIDINSRPAQPVQVIDSKILHFPQEPKITERPTTQSTKLRKVTRSPRDDARTTTTMKTYTRSSGRGTVKFSDKL